MPRGYPDFAGERAKKSFFSVLDLGELAVRLGAIPSIDRSGEVMFFDSFEEGLCKWSVGTNAVVEVSPVTARTGGYSLRVTQPGTDPNFMTIYRYHFPFFPSAFGVEISFTTVITGGIDVYITNVYYNLGYDVEARVKVESESGAIDVYDFENSRWVNVGSGHLIPTLRRFNTLKFVVDPLTLKYKRIFLNSTIIDNIPVLARKVSPVGALKGLTIWAFPGDTGEIFLDDIILTCEEP